MAFTLIGFLKWLSPKLDWFCTVGQYPICDWWFGQVYLPIPEGWELKDGRLAQRNEP